MNPESCPDCGAVLKSGTKYCPACFLSAGQATEPMEPVSAGLISLPCDVGNYRLVRKLGAGGMGVVYEAEDRATGRRLALKVLRQAIDTEEQRKRFRREGRLAASVNHPNSLYVFGTDEIEGVPVIATELADGGTLRDEVKRRGPLPVRDAVDAMLSVIDGLESAHCHGVLHRDMKPSNCFVSSEGGTKVGDYGLSISHLEENSGEESLTRSGVIMGTPAFSPPEQLLGEALDQRADIYSTAATLYYLLTGKAPVEAENSVGTVAAVLAGRIKPPHELRPDLPLNLSSAIMRGLAKDKAKRPASHADFRLTLVPFSAEAPQPAPLGLRLLAGIVDGTILMCLSLFLWMLPALGAMTTEGQITLVNLATAAATVLGYTLLETRLGTTPGKRLFGLQVLGSGGALPTWWPCLMRSSLFVACWSLISFVPETWMDSRSEDGSMTPPEFAFFLGCYLLVLNFQFVLFIPSLRRTDRAAWHDLVSGMRVTRCRRSMARPAMKSAVPESPVDGSGLLWGGLIPGEEINSQLRWAHDPLLQRPLLLQRRCEVSAPPSAARRFCARPGRLRWHQTVIDPEGECWDVWQAIPGQPLEALSALQPAPRASFIDRWIGENKTLYGAPDEPCWDRVLPWLHDLAVEMDAAQKDGTLPCEFSSSHIWITTGGHAVLLDDAWPASQPPRFRSQEPQAFLAEVAGLATATSRPLHADPVLKSLQKNRFERLSHVAGTLSHLRQLPSSVDRAKRAVCLLAPTISAIVVALAFATVLLNSYHEWTSIFPGQPPLPEVMQLHLEQTKAHGAEHPLKEAIQRHVAGHYGPYIREHGMDSLPLSHRDFFTDAVENFVAHQIEVAPVMDPAALELADEEIRQALESNTVKWRLADAFSVEASQVSAALLMGGTLFTGVCQLISILLLGSPFLMHLSGVSVVTNTKRPASRARMVWRWCLGWSVILLLTSPANVFAIVLPEKFPSIYDSLHAAVFLSPSILLLLWLSIFPLLGRRSLLDRVAGTWLVAR
jgi:uncharacterized RDD family membrane protein YckC